MEPGSGRVAKDSRWIINCMINDLDYSTGESARGMGTLKVAPIESHSGTAHLFDLPLLRKRGTSARTTNLPLHNS